MAGRHHGCAIAVRDGLVTRKRDEDPDPASVAADADGVTYCTSVLPWRSCGTGRPWRGRAVAAKTRAARSALTAALLPGNTIWGGDWNHTLSGREYAGRRTILDAVAALELTVATAELPHQLKDLSTVDHIAVPTSATVACRSAYR